MANKFFEAAKKFVSGEKPAENFWTNLEGQEFQRVWWILDVLEDYSLGEGEKMWVVVDGDVLKGDGKKASEITLHIYTEGEYVSPRLWGYLEKCRDDGGLK